MSQGLNLLGYKGICETLYTTLLPGLNAVTSRIRYYSFYCWLLSELPNQVSPISEKSYVAYIRKAEYLLALIHAQMNNGEGVTGIPGIDKAIVNFKEAGEQISLVEGIYKSDGVSTAGTYWKNKGGVLAQYYLASMSDDMGLLEATNEKASIRNISRKEGFINGAKLAESFKASIGDTDANLFLAAVKSGSVSKTELGQLINGKSQSLFATCFCQFAYHVAFSVFPWSRLHRIISIFRWPHAEAAMMLGCEDNAFHACILAGSDPLPCVEI